MKRSIAMVFPLALVVWAAAGSPGLAATNLLANPGFEDFGGSYNGWTILSGTGPNISTPAGDDIYRSGAAAAKIFGEFTNCPIPNFDVGVFGQSFSPTAGKVYELSAWTFISSGDPLTGASVCASNRLVMKIAFFNAPVGGTEISSNEIVAGAASMPTDVWTQFAVQAPAPTGAMRAEALFLFLQPGCDLGSVFVDDASFCELPGPAAETNILANPGFNTGLTGWTKFDNVFHDTRSFARYSTAGSAKLFGPFTVAGASSGLFQSFAASPGTEWKFRIWALNTCVDSPVNLANDNVGTIKIVFRDGGGTEIGSGETTIVTNSTPLGTWTHHTAVATAPVGTVTVQPFILFTQPTNMGGAMFVDDAVFCETQVVDAPVIASGRPEPELRQNVPNPFSPSTRIEFVLDRTEDVALTVYDVAGRRVATLLEGRAMPPGLHGIVWDGTTLDGTPAAAGIYHYVLDTPDARQARSMIRVR